MKKIMFIALSSLLCATTTITPVYAVENDADTATNLFDELASKYEGLSQNYGNISTSDSEGYNAYLESIQNNEKSLSFNDSLSTIKNFDYKKHENTDEISKVMGAANAKADGLKSDGKALSKAFEEKYIKAEADAKARLEASRNAGQSEYAAGQNKYNAQSAEVQSKMNNAQNTYANHLAKYQNAAAGGTAIKGSGDYGLPPFNDVILQKLSAEMGIVTPKEKGRAEEAKREKAQQEQEASSKQNTKQKVYTSNAYQAGVGY